MSENVTLYVKQKIAVSHRLELPYESKCKRLHGHNLLIEVWLKGRVIEELGMLVDVTKVKKIIKEYDHEHLNKFLAQPTMENLAIKLAKRFLREFDNVDSVKIRVWESCKSYVEVEYRRVSEEDNKKDEMSKL